MLTRLSLGLGLVLLIGSTAIAQAQSTTGESLSAEEMEKLFSKQKTRGLVLAPAPGSETETEAAATDTTDTATTTTTATATQTAPTPPVETYVELAPDEQVNIQISFDFDSAALRTDQKPKLTTLCTVMQKVDVNLFRIVGHTDASGAADYNERLSLLRAQEVKRFLVSDCGIAETRLEAVGVGEAFPLDKADPRGDVNRRVEFQALS